MIALCLVASLSCAPDPGEELRRLAPELNPSMARHLALSDDETLDRYCAMVGIRDLIDARLALRRAIPFDAPDAYATGARALMPHIGRLSSQLARRYGCLEFLRDDQFWMSLEAEQAVELGRLEAEMNAVYLDGELLLGEKIARLERLGERFREVGYPTGGVLADVAVAEFLGALGQESGRAQRLRAALDGARRADLTIVQAQVLGALGEVHRAAGRTDSMAIAWNEAMLIATRHRLPEHAAATMANYAAHYAAQGRLALAADRYAAAQEICREYQGGYLELPFVLKTMFFHAEVGQLEVVRQLLPRARVLQRESARSPRVVEHRINALRLDELEARALMSQGRVAEAVALFQQLEPAVRGLPSRYDYAQLLLAWTGGLIENGLLADALPLIGRGLVASAGGSLPATRARFQLQLARALRGLGNVGAALQTLSDFRQAAQGLGADGLRLLSSEWAAHDAELAGLHIERGDLPEARRALRAGLERLRAVLSASEPGAQGYGILNRADDLRYALHACLRGDPVATYGLELEWRRLPMVLGETARARERWANGEATRARQPHGSSVWDGVPPHALPAQPFGGTPHLPAPSIDGLIRLLDAPAAPTSRTVESLRALRERRAVHLVYLLTPRGIVRWTATPDGVRCDTLAIAVQDARPLVARALAQVSSDPGDPDAPPDAELARLLHLLATALLPPEVMLVAGEREIDEVLISPDGFLGLLPFSAYNLREGDGYEPLAERYAVTYLRHTRSGQAPVARGPGIILTDPQAPDAIRRRYPIPSRLEQARAEVDRLAQARPGALVLAGEEATKHALLQAWEEAPFLYAASHFIRDPELPYLTFMPLSLPARSARIEQSYLDIDDIRAADLLRCRLVVLSGCASGAPYVTAGKANPGLGDALLDAGAHAVVETFWRVRDDEAARLMLAFIDAWAERGLSPEEALSVAQREAMHGARGVRHPFTWAAYAVKLGRM